MALVVTIAGVNRTAVVKEDTIRITQLAESFTFTAELVVFDASSDISIVAGSHLVADEITIVDGATTFFGGYVANQDIASKEGGSRDLSLQCQGYGILLSETLVEYEEYTGTGDDAIIDDLFDTYLAAIDSVTHVAQLDADMDVLFSEMSLAEIMEAMCQRTGGRWYIDNEKKLHYFADENDDCGFDLADNPDQIGSFSYYEETEKRTDASQIVNSVRVIGADGYAVNRTDAPSIATYGIRQALVTDAGLTTTAELEERGDAILEKHKDPKVTYVVRTDHGGAVAGQEIDYKNVVLGLVALTKFTIRELCIYWELGEPVYEMVLGEVEQGALVRASTASTTIRRVVIDPQVPLASRGWGHDLVFSATDNNTVAWEAGTITTAGGLSSYSIDAGDTGDMAAITYVYLDVNVSLTVLQTTTSVADAIAATKILVAVCSNVAADKDAVFQVFGGAGNTSLIIADMVGANEVTANLVGANQIITSAANIDDAVIENAHIVDLDGDKIHANTITADKLILGEGPFTPDEGLLLLGQPLKLQRGATNRWVSTRGQKATIAGALHPMQGRWQSTQALLIEAGVANYFSNPIFGHATYDTNWQNLGSNPPTHAEETSDVRFGSSSVEVTFGGANSVFGENVIAQKATLDGQELWLSAWVKTSASDVTILFVADNASYSPINPAHPGDGKWHRIYCNVTPTFDSGGATTFIVIGVKGNTATTTAVVDGFQLEIGPSPTSLAVGSMGDGYSWAGTAHASKSSRSASYIVLDDYVGLLESNNTWSIACWVQVPRAWNDTWPDSDNKVWDVAKTGDNNNRVNLTYNSSTGYWCLYINGNYRCNLASGSFSAGDWIQLVATLDFGNNSYCLYLNAHTNYADTTSLTAPAGLTDWNVGSNYVGDRQGGFALGEYAVFDDVLSSTEVAMLYELLRPLTDFAASEVPGILLTSHSGNRIEITAYELAVYEDNDKCVEVDNDGIAILTSDDYEDIRSYQFVKSDGEVVTSIASFYETVTDYHRLRVLAKSITGQSSQVHVYAESPSGEVAGVHMRAYHVAGNYAEAYVLTNGSNVSYFYVDIDAATQLRAIAGYVEFQTKIRGNGNNSFVVVDTGTSGTGGIRPDVSGVVSGYLGTATYEWNYSYVDNYAGMALLDPDDQVELVDGRVLDPLSAMRAQGRTENVRRGEFELSTKDVPRFCYIEGEFAEEDIYEDGELKWRKGEQCGRDSVELISYISFMRKVVLQQADRLERLEAALDKLCEEKE